MLMGHHTRHIPSRVGRLPRAFFMLLTSLALAGCSVVYTLHPETAVEDTLKTLPIPEAASQLYEREGFSYGSRDSCTAAYTYRVYGTKLAFDEVVRFYQEHLRADGWQQEEGLSGPTWFSQTRHFCLALSPDAEASGAPPESIREGVQRYRTVYYVALTYMVDPSCWQV